MLQPICAFVHRKVGIEANVKSPRRRGLTIRNRQTRKLLQCADIPTKKRVRNLFNKCVPATLLFRLHSCWRSPIHHMNYSRAFPYCRGSDNRRRHANCGSLPAATSHIRLRILSVALLSFRQLNHCVRPNPGWSRRNKFIVLNADRLFLISVSLRSTIELDVPWGLFRLVCCISSV